jgi:hypothetical protein
MIQSASVETKLQKSLQSQMLGKKYTMENNIFIPVFVTLVKKKTLDFSFMSKERLY